MSPIPKGLRIVAAAFSENLLLPRSGDLLDGAVPGDDLLVVVDDDRGIRQELDDVRQPLLCRCRLFEESMGRGLALAKGLLGAHAPDRGAHLSGETLEADANPRLHPVQDTRSEIQRGNGNPVAQDGEDRHGKKSLARAQWRVPLEARTIQVARATFPDQPRLSRIAVKLPDQGDELLAQPAVACQLDSARIGVHQIHPAAVHTLRRQAGIEDSPKAHDRDR